MAPIRVVKNGNGGNGGKKKVIKGFGWKGAVTPQKWMNFYTKVLSPLVSTPGLTLEVRFEVVAGESANEAKIESTRGGPPRIGTFGGCRGSIRLTPHQGRSTWAATPIHSFTDVL